MNQASSNKGGFSLVEVVVAIMVLSFGLLAMAASTGYVASQTRSATWDTQRNLARQEMVERLRATVFANVNTNTNWTSAGRYTFRWNVTQLSASQRSVQLITRGPAYRSGRGAQTTVTDTAVFVIMRPL